MLILCYRQYTLYYMIYISSIFDPFANIKFLKNIISYLLFISSLMFIMYGWWKVNNLGKYWNRCEQSVLNHNQSPLPSNWYLKEFVACTCNYWPFQVVFFILMLCHESQNFIEHDPIFTNLSMLDKGRTLNRSVWQYLVKSIVLPGQKMSIFFHLCYIADRLIRSTSNVLRPALKHCWYFVGVCAVPQQIPIKQNITVQRQWMYGHSQNLAHQSQGV